MESPGLWPLPVTNQHAYRPSLWLLVGTVAHFVSRRGNPLRMDGQRRTDVGSPMGFWALVSRGGKWTQTWPLGLPAMANDGRNKAPAELRLGLGHGLVMLDAGSIDFDGLCLVRVWLCGADVARRLP